MRRVHISEYGKRHGFIRSFIAGEGYFSQLHFPSNPSMKHALIKMLLLIKLKPLETRKDILHFYESNALIRHICSYGNSFTPFIDHYWSDLHRNGYLAQFRDGRKIYYCLTDKGNETLKSIPKEERILLHKLISF